MQPFSKMQARSKYQVQSPRVGKVKSPLAKTKQQKYPEQYIYLNKTGKERKKQQFFGMMKPTTECAIEPEISAEESLLLRSQIQTHAAEQIQKRIREFLNRQRVAKAVMQQQDAAAQTQTKIGSQNGTLTLTGKSGRKIQIGKKDPEIEPISSFLEEEDKTD